MGGKAVGGGGGVGLACGYTSIFIWTHNWYWRTMLPCWCHYNNVQGGRV